MAQEEVGGVDALVAGIGIGEELADVRESGGAGEGIDEGVDDDVGIRVAIKALVMGDGDVGQDQRPPGDGAVEIVAKTDAEGRHEDRV